MKTCARDLPVELWLSIFSYFEVHELFHSFANINDYFDGLLNCDHLLFYLRLEKNDQDLFIKIKLNRIWHLQSTLWHLTEGFPRFIHHQIDELIRLKSLKFHISSLQTNLLCQALKTLSSLECLSLRCQMTDELYASILSAPSLRILHLELYKSNESVIYNSHQNNNLEAFHMNISTQSDYSVLNLFLLHLLKLKRLEIFHHDYGYGGSTISFLHQPFLFPNLRIVKLKWNFRYMQKDIFEQLRKSMPILKRLSLDIYCHYLNEHFFSYLIDDWWFIFIEIEHIHIAIRGYSDFPNIPADNQRKQLEYYRENFFSRNEQFDQRYKITWNQIDTSQLIYMEISMC